MQTQKIWTDGRRDGVACITATIYPHTIVATSDPEHITRHQMKKALTKEFPRHSFVFNSNGGDCLRADASRWIEDEV